MESQVLSIANNRVAAGRNILTGLPAEIVLEIAKNLPNFSSMDNFLQSNKLLMEVIQSCQYSICEQVAKNELGTLWMDARQLLVLQAKLNRAAAPVKGPAGKFPGIGILKGGDRIGIAEATQIMSNATEVIRCRTNFISTGSCFNTSTLMLQSDFQIDRGYYHYWTILLACAPGLKGLLQQRKKQKGKNTEPLTDEEREKIYWTRHVDVEEFLRYEGRMTEFEELLVVMCNSWQFRVLPLIEPKDRERSNEMWCRKNEDILKAELRVHVLLTSRKLGFAEYQDLENIFMFGP